MEKRKIKKTARSTRYANEILLLFYNITSKVEMEATKAKSATVTVLPATHGDDVKNISKNASASWIFFSLSSVFGTPANIHGY